MPQLGQLILNPEERQEQQAPPLFELDSPTAFAALIYFFSHFYLHYSLLYIVPAMGMLIFENYRISNLKRIIAQSSDNFSVVMSGFFKPSVAAIIIIFLAQILHISNEQ